jgi:transcriptional regulator with XRE-family HTH domain
VTNERLRDAIQSSGITPAQLAAELGVDPKTVERWITKGREPYSKHRHAVAAKLGERELYLWPSAISDTKAQQVSESEVVRIYQNRNTVPGDLWDLLLSQAKENVDILVYVGMFMTEKPDLVATLTEKAATGTKIRLLFGDRNSPAVIQRSTDEGIGAHTISAKIDHALAYFKVLNSVSGIEMRTHGTVLYNSIYRFDNEMIVNSHVFGKVASHAPAMHLRKLSMGDLFMTYVDSGAIRKLRYRSWQGGPDLRKPVRRSEFPNDFSFSAVWNNACSIDNRLS